MMRDHSKQSGFWRTRALLVAALLCGGLTVLTAQMARWPASPPPPAAQRHALDDMDPDMFVFPRLCYVTLARTYDEWDSHPFADDVLLDYVQRVTNIKLTKRTWEDRVVRIDDFSKMYSVPFMFMTGQGDFHLTGEQAATLGEYFRRGGFIYADECVDMPRGGDIFYKAFLREFPKTLPGAELRPLTIEHQIYHCFYDFRKVPQYKGISHPDMGFYYNDRMVAFLTSTDHHCAWSNVEIPQGGEEASLQMGVNIVIYALTH